MSRPFLRVLTREARVCASLASPVLCAGLGPSARALAPAVAGLQAEAEVDLTAVRVPANQGLFILLFPR